jgi:Trk K+ transport system NAD-binding subunit
LQVTEVGATCYNLVIMKVVIVGAGAVGYQLAKQLISENKDVVLIENLVVYPEIDAARAIMSAVDFGAVSDIMVFEQSQVQIRTIVVERDGPLSGHSLQELSHILPGTFLVAVVIRDNHYMIPSGETRLQGGDILYIVANADDFDRIFAHIGKGRHSLKRVILVGGGPDMLRSQPSSASTVR